MRYMISFHEWTEPFFVLLRPHPEVATLMLVLVFMIILLIAYEIGF